MYDEDGEHLPLSSNSRSCEDLKNDTNLQMARILSTIHLIQARTFRVTVLPTSTPWTADVIGPLLPKGCQVPLLAKYLWECLFHQAYICGPPAFFASTRDLLQEVYLDSYLYLDEVKTPLSLQGGVGAGRHLLWVLWTTSLEKTIALLDKTQSEQGYQHISHVPFVYIGLVNACVKVFFHSSLSCFIESNKVFANL